MSRLVGNTVDRFSCDEAHMSSVYGVKQGSKTRLYHLLYIVFGIVKLT